MAVLMAEHHARGSEVSQSDFNLFIINLLDHCLPNQLELLLNYVFAFSLPRHDTIAEITNIQEDPLLYFLSVLRDDLL